MVELTTTTGETYSMAQTQAIAPRVGEQAPSFTLKSSDLKDISLSDFTGQTVVLAFFPAAFTSVCTAEMCSFRDQLTQLNGANAQVLGISVDLPMSLARFKEAEQLNFPVLSDFDRVVIHDYGVEFSNFQGYRSPVAQRAVFVIDPTGKIAWEWIADHPGQSPDYGQVMEAVEQIAPR